MELLSKNSLFSIYRITEDILYLRFLNSFEHNHSLLRASAYYESPVYRNCSAIDINDLKDWYRRSFGRSQSCLGFNITSESFLSFFKEHLESLSPMEDSIFKALKTQSFKYLISTSKDDESEQSTFEHELSHAIFSLDLEYKEIASSLVMSMPKIKFFESKLRKMGYCDTVMIDEMAAYALSMSYLELILFSKSKNEDRLDESLYIEYYKINRELRFAFVKRVYSFLGLGPSLLQKLHSFAPHGFSQHLSTIDKSFQGDA